MKVWEFSCEKGGWSPCFSMPFFDWEIGGGGEVFSYTIEGQKVLPNRRMGYS